MIYTRTINDDSTTSSEKQKQQEENQEITTLTRWEVNIGYRLSELSRAILARGEIKDEWHREIYCICDFITYMKMNNKKESHYD